MTQTQAPSAFPTMADLYDRLATIGLPKKFVRDKILPDWWTAEVDEDPSLLMEGAMYLSRRLNLDIVSLVNSDTPQFLPSAKPKFKTQSGTDPSRLALPHALASRIAEIVAQACPQPYQDITTLEARQIRGQILQQYNSSINLASLLDFCWSYGIPVLHFNQFPSGKALHGMVAYFHCRPVILISRSECSPAWLAFILAHELGHLLNGHLNTERVLVDEAIQLESDDAEENEANETAVELLLDLPGISYDIRSTFLKGETLATKARAFAQDSYNDPSIIALNVAWNRARRARTKKEAIIAWATGQTALKILGSNSDAPQQINQRLLQSLNWDSLTEENQEYLATMLNLSLESVGVG